MENEKWKMKNRNKQKIKIKQLKILLKIKKEGRRCAWLHISEMTMMTHLDAGH